MKRGEGSGTGPDADRLRAAIRRRWPAGAPVHPEIARDVNRVEANGVWGDDIGAILAGKRSLAGAKGGAVLRWVEKQEEAS